MDKATKDRPVGRQETSDPGLTHWYPVVPGTRAEVGAVAHCGWVKQRPTPPEGCPVVTCVVCVDIVGRS